MRKKINIKKVYYKTPHAMWRFYGYYGGLKILSLKLDERHWPVIKPFLVFLKAIRSNQYTDIESNPEVEKKLRKI